MPQPVLFLGSRNDAVAPLIDLLRAQGFWDGDTPSLFDKHVERAVRYFQQTHLDPSGTFLKSDGVVGERTWWALNNPSGNRQRSNIVPSMPANLLPKRTRILQVALAEHTKAVREQPDGSNRGPEVDKYLPPWHRTRGKGPAWCCFFYSWVVQQALGAFPLGTRVGAVVRARELAVERGLWTPKTVPGGRPYPGDAFVMEHGDGTGHIGFVLRTSVDGKSINTIEGNSGNRVKVGLRSLSNRDIVGFIDNVRDEASNDFERGVLTASKLDGSGTR